MSARLGWWCYETTTPITEGTYRAARSAVDVALSAADAVVGGEPIAYGLCRPPGHHASMTLYGGYCFFNNAAIAAHHLASSTGARIAVLDVDYHHGNGTQQIFYERDDVAFVSLHGDPRTGLPLPHSGSPTRPAPDVDGDRPPTSRWTPERTTTPISARWIGPSTPSTTFDPAIVVVSLGPRHVRRRSDLRPGVTTEGFGRCGAAVAARGRPLVVLQEGGYADDALGANVVAWLTGAPPSLL